LNRYNAEYLLAEIVLNCVCSIYTGYMNGQWTTAIDLLPFQ